MIKQVRSAIRSIRNSVNPGPTDCECVLIEVASTLKTTFSESHS